MGTFPNGKSVTFGNPCRNKLFVNKNNIKQFNNLRSVPNVPISERKGPSLACVEYIVTNNDNGKSIKDILLSRLHISHRLLITLKRENSIFLNDLPAFVYQNVGVNDKIRVSFDYAENNSNIISKQIPLDIVYEDEWLLIVNKCSGIPVHPSILHYEDSLSSGIKFYFDSIGLNKKIRPVNRIDKDTSGLVVFAKNEYIQEALIKQMQSGTFIKEYIAIVEGFFNNNEKISTINMPISRKEGSIIERCVSNTR